MSILIDPAKVHDNASQIENLGLKMHEKMNEVNVKVKALSADWQDQKQQTYDADFAKLMQNFESFAEIIPSYAKEAHAHADQMSLIGKS